MSKGIALVGLLSLFTVARTEAQLESTRIAFFSDRDGDFEIYVMNTDGTSPVQITFNPAADSGPAWSPDGSEIAFISDRDGDSEVYMMNSDGTGVLQLTHNTAIDSAPSWSPSGTQITFESQRDTNQEIYVMNADGTGQINLTNNGANDGQPDWSPDGTQIAFVSNRADGSHTDIYVMHTDGTNVTRLTFGLFAGLPTWSPDDSQIAFSHDGTLYVMDANGSNQTPLLSAPGSVSPNMSDWSPDGSKIALFTNQFDGDFEIYVMDSDGSNLVNLTKNPAADLAPSWSPVLIKEVDIDIKPGSDPNCFNLNGHGVIPVAILGGADLDVGDIDFDSLLFDGLAVRVRGNRGPLCSFEHVNGDSFLDLVCHFEDDPENWTAGEDTATLSGNLFDGTPIEGTDSICIVP